MPSTTEDVRDEDLHDVSEATGRSKRKIKRVSQSFLASLTALSDDERGEGGISE